MGGMEPQGISRVGQIVFARLMESQIPHPPAGFVDLWGKGSEKRLSVWMIAVPQLSPGCQILLFLLICHWCLSSCYPS